MTRTGSLHIVCIDARYVVYFAPYEGDLDRLPQRTCSGTTELDGVLTDLGFAQPARVRLIADVQRDSARTTPEVDATDARLRELGFEFR